MIKSIGGQGDSEMALGHEQDGRMAVAGEAQQPQLGGIAAQAGKTRAEQWQDACPHGGKIQQTAFSEIAALCGKIF